MLALTLCLLSFPELYNFASEVIHTLPQSCIIYVWTCGIHQKKLTLFSLGTNFIVSARFIKDSVNRNDHFKPLFRCPAPWVYTGIIYLFNFYRKCGNTVLVLSQAFIRSIKCVIWLDTGLTANKFISYPPEVSVAVWLKRVRMRASPERKKIKNLMNIAQLFYYLFTVLG